MKKLLLTTLLVLSAFNLSAQTTILAVGDIAILQIKADDPDDYTFITFVDIAAGTKIYFTDCGATSAGVFGSNPIYFPNDATACSEGADLYTTPAGGLSAGDIVTWSSSSDFVDYTDAGMRRAGGGTNISTAGDQIFVFQDADGDGGQVPGRNPRGIFIAHISSTLFTGNGADGTTQSSLPTGLSDTSNPRTAVALGAGTGVKDAYDNAVYNGTYDFSSAGSQTAALAAAKVAMTNPSNFFKTDDRNSATLASVISAIPARLTLVAAASLPTVTTVAASSISSTSATLAGNATANGGATITERGIVYSITGTNSSPLINGTGVIKNINGSGTGAFSKNITGLTTNTSYSYKAYAINSVGTSYGSVGTFATPDITSPVFESSTPSSSSITQTGFTLATNIDEAGKVFYVVVADGASGPSSLEVKAGTGSGGSGQVTAGNSTVSTGAFSNNFSVTSLNAGTAYDIYVVAEDDEGTPNLQTSPTKVDVTTSPPSSLQVAATVFLEGAYNGTNLNTIINGSIPTAQPYSINGHSGGTAVSIPSGAVDWVLVELREAGSAAGAVNSTKKGSAAGFLMNDGTIKATNGTSNLTVNLSNNTGTDYYVVIYHRNHLPIMSASARSGSGGTLTIDFTSSSANTYQTTTALVSLSGGKFGMPAGDTNNSGTIDATDFGTWRTNNGIVYSYSGNGVSDFNLDGVINAIDRNDFQQKNIAKTRQVPTT